MGQDLLSRATIAYSKDLEEKRLKKEQREKENLIKARAIQEDNIKRLRKNISITLGIVLQDNQIIRDPIETSSNVICIIDDLVFKACGDNSLAMGRWYHEKTKNYQYGHVNWWTVRELKDIGMILRDTRFLNAYQKDKDYFKDYQ